MIDLLVASQILNLYTMLYYRYLVRSQPIPILSKHESQELLRELLDSGVYKTSDLRLYGIRHCDIVSCKNKRKKIRMELKNNTLDKQKVNNKSLLKINSKIDSRNGCK